MNKPDLTQDRELVELAEVMREAHLAKMAERGYPVQLYNSEYLAMADAARTHLGSGYTLPAANEANAERLAREVVEWFSIDNFDQLVPVVKRARIRSAKEHLQALHAAFGEPEKPAPKSEHAEKPVRDPVSRDEQREYEALVLQFALATCNHVDIEVAIGMADRYLAWRKQGREAACRK